MKVNNTKDLFLLYTLLGTTEMNTISSTTLSELLSLSSKSIQNSIASLNDHCRQHGFEILSKAGAGFYCKILEPPKAQIFKQHLTAYFSKNHLIYDSESLELGNFILFLSNQNRPISIYELCNRFYLSRSKTYTYITKCKELLPHSGLELINERGRGVYVEGPEFIRRNFVAFCFGNPIFQYDIHTLFDQDFYFIGKQPSLIPHILQILQDYSISLDDEKLNAFFVYLAYSQYRCQRSYRLQGFDGTEIKHISQCPEYACAKKLSLLLFPSDMNNPDELAGIAAFLLCNDGQQKEITPNYCGNFYYERISDFYAYLNEYIASLSHSFLSIPGYVSILWQLAAHLYFQYHFGVATCSFSNIEYNLNITSNAMIRYLARLLTERVNHYFGQYIKFIPAACICSFSQDLLYRARQERNDIRLLLILKEGLSYCGHITNWLYDHLRPEPVQIDVMSLTQISTADLNPYDIILSDYGNLDYVQGNYKVYPITHPIDLDTAFISAYFRTVNMRDVSLEQIVHLFPIIRIKKDCEILNTHALLEALDIDLDGLGDIPFRTIRKLGKPINYYSGNNILVVPYLFKERGSHEDMLLIYLNDKKKHLKYNAMVFFSIQSTFEINSLFYLIDLCNEFCVHPDIFEQLAEHISAR